MLNRNHPTIIKMYKDARNAGEYTAEHAFKTIDKDKSYNVFKGWADTRAVLKYYYGAKTFTPHEVVLRKAFVEAYKRSQHDS